MSSSEILGNFCCVLWLAGTGPSIVSTSFNLRPGTYSLYHVNTYMTFYAHIYGSKLHESYSYESGRSLPLPLSLSLSNLGTISADLLFLIWLLNINMLIIIL